MVAVLYVSLFRRTSSKPKSYSHSLRHVEYYRGILFLTTNRITALDEAFLSRIHVALNFSELSASAKAQVWRAFLTKAGVSESEVDDTLVQKLAERDINGRQIKNIVKTAGALAQGRQETLGYAHLEQVLDLMEQFDTAYVSTSRRLCSFADPHFPSDILCINRDDTDTTTAMTLYTSYWMDMFVVL